MADVIRLHVKYGVYLGDRCLGLFDRREQAESLCYPGSNREVRESPSRTTAAVSDAPSCDRV